VIHTPMKHASPRFVQFHVAQLETLVAIVEEGTFEAAARRLRLTPSAVSQRIRALEHTAGQVLVRRSTPCSATAAGEPLVRLGRQIRLLVQEATSALPAAEVVELSVGVNADSLRTWFADVIAEVAHWPATALRLTLEEEQQSHDLLRRGEVPAAVTSEPRPVQGCVVESLGSMRYTPAAAPALPVVTYSDQDRLQHDLLAAHGVPRPPVVHRVPASADFHEAIRRGLGWGMLLDPQLTPDIAAGALMRLPGGQPVDVPLYWQRWRLDSPTLARLTEAVRRAAAAGLRKIRAACRFGRAQCLSNEC
jgi:LysR family transcriptional regulator (chromosome initiation inhibitor)